MAMYVIDSKRQLWRIDRSVTDDAESLPVERLREDGKGWETARVSYSDDLVIDPTDAELAELDEAELARFGLTV